MWKGGENEREFKSTVLNCSISWNNMTYYALTGNFILKLIPPWNVSVLEIKDASYPDFGKAMLFVEIIVKISGQWRREVKSKSC